MNYKEEYNKIESYIGSLGFGWVCAQVREEIETGKLNEEKIPTLNEYSRSNQQQGFFYPADFRKGQAADFVKRSEYSDKQKLALLVEAIKRAIPELILMEAQVAAYFDNIEVISFTSDKDDKEKLEIIKREGKAIDDTRKAVEALDSLINGLGGV